RDIPLAEVAEIYDLRAMLDEAVGRRLAEGITPEQLKSLRSVVEAMEKAVKAGDVDSYHLLNIGFHDRLVEYVGNGKLGAMYRRLINELSLVRRMTLADRQTLPGSVAEHRAIVRAIASGDPDAAGKAMRQHALDSKARTLRRREAAKVEGAAPARRVTHA